MSGDPSEVVPEVRLKNVQEQIIDQDCQSLSRTGDPIKRRIVE
jgi:hypothetical protein